MARDGGTCPAKALRKPRTHHVACSGAVAEGADIVSIQRERQSVPLDSAYVVACQGALIARLLGSPCHEPPAGPFNCELFPWTPGGWLCHGSMAAHDALGETGAGIAVVRKCLAQQ